MPAQKGSLLEVAQVFFKLGLIAFGGPAAHIAMMEEEVVTKRKWMDQQHFLDLVGATNLVPGPNSTEMTMHCGKERAGWPGLFVAGFCFIFPAVVLTGFLAFLYVNYGTLPNVEPFLYGIKPAVMAIIIGAIFKLGKKALKSWQLGVLGSLVVIAAFLGVNEVVAILGAGLIGLLLNASFGRKSLQSTLPLLATGIAPIAVKQIASTKIFLVFLKIGAVLFGSGYVLVAYLDGELVETLNWLTNQQLMDAIAIGQFTPGPVLSTATFVGYQVGGIGGAVAATLGIFLPSFFFVLLLNPLVPKLRKSTGAASFLDAVNIGAVGIMVAATVRLGENTLLSWQAWVIALISVLVTFYVKKVSALWIVIGSSILGYLLQLI